MSGVLYSERTLIIRAIRQAHINYHGNKMWFAVTRLFACGSAVAHAICEEYGFDPDEDL